MAEPLLTVDDAQVAFAARRSLLDTILRRPVRPIRAVDGVSFAVRPGEVLALVGESGSGKTTTGNLLLGLLPASEGRVMLEGRNVGEMTGRQLARLRRNVQMIFQDPYESLNPRMRVVDIVAEPLRVHHVVHDAREAEPRVRDALEEAGLSPADAYLHRLPYELSGGQRQRVAIAAALALRPRLLVADEPVSMLDVSIRADILNLLRSLADEHGIAVLMITHDLSTVAAYADRIAVMYLGRMVETGPAREVLANPQHPYTRALISVIPVPNPRLRRERVILQGETPNPINLPGGCRFHPRCPVAIEACKATDPATVKVGENHHAACLLLNPR